jgi:hypothetical protein
MMTLYSIIKRVFISNLIPLRWTLGWFAILFSVGLLVANVHSGEYDQLLARAPAEVWAAIAMLYAVLRLHSVFILTKTTQVLSIIAGFIGIALWGSLFTSVFMNTDHSIGAAPIILVGIILSEVWVCASALSDNGAERRDRRIGDRRMY